MKYEEYINLFQYNRFKTQKVQVGSVGFGGENPIRIQSMTNTNTLKTDDTIKQSLKIIKAGGDLVRITAQGVKEAENLKNIKKGIRDEGFDTPVVADIHFNPKAAFSAAKIVEKVRINPGNFVDKRAGLTKTNFSEEEYKQEIAKIKEKLIPLINICKENNTALRVGVNHGSLSDRIMSGFGDTPEGMVESAMEFLRICVQENFLNILVSLKSSNTRVMVQANRLMLAKMFEEKMNFPLHLGVTEAGEGEDGRIKSAVGIGTLLADGIGDTIRVSLTEAPEKEIPVAKKLIDYFADRTDHKPIPGVGLIETDFFDYKKRKTKEILSIGGDNIPVVIAKKESKNDLLPEFVYVGDRFVIDSSNVDTIFIIDESGWDQQIFQNDNVVPLFKSINDFYFSDNQSEKLNFIRLNCNEITKENLQKIKNFKNTVLILESSNKNGYADLRAAFLRMMSAGTDIPVIIKRTYKEKELENLQLKASCDIGGMFLDGFGDGIWIENQSDQREVYIEEQDIISTSFGILQASRVRISKTEYISCPGCGRTLFDIEKTTKKIREKTSQLKNLKIGIMGCIVNGPGEMADADYGYVGAGPGKITLYKNKEIVKKNIPEEKAVEELIQLIKENGDWI